MIIPKKYLQEELVLEQTQVGLHFVLTACSRLLASGQYYTTTYKAEWNNKQEQINILNKHTIKCNKNQDMP